MMEKKIIAVDIGASSGRFYLGSFNGSRLKVSELSRFYHTPASFGRDVYWDFLQIWNSICDGLHNARKEHGEINSIGMDSFAPDFGFFDGRGRLLSNMLSYRTVLGSRILDETLDDEAQEELFAYSGIRCADILMLPQLLYLLRTDRKWLLENGTLLPLVNGLISQLTGEGYMDFTVASISLLWDSRKSAFSQELIKRFLGMDRFLPKIAGNQTVVGTVLPSVLGSAFAHTAVVNGGVHDTAVATYALNLSARGQICMNCGTWTSISVVSEKPVTSREAIDSGLTNYGLPDGTYMFGKVMLGLFYLQKCRAEWARRDREYSYPELSALAAQAKRYVLDLDDPVFGGTEESILDRITVYFTSRSQSAPVTIGEFARCILESLAVRYAKIIRAIEQTTGETYGQIHMGGGGIQDRLLCEMIRRETGKELCFVATEVTAVGNLLSQLIAQKDIRAEEAASLLAFGAKESKEKEE